MQAMKKYRHIIWDFNGTLLNDTGICVKILNDMLSRRKRTPVTQDRYRDEFDFPVESYYRKIGFDFSVEPYAQIADEFLRQYNDALAQCSLQPGSIEVLEHIKNQGLAQSVLSAFQQTLLENALNRFQIADYFTHIVGLDHVYADSKLVIGKRLINALEIAPAQVLLIGDTTHDHQVASHIGADCALIAHGHHPRHRLTNVTALVFDDLTDILSLLDD